MLKSVGGGGAPTPTSQVAQADTAFKGAFQHSQRRRWPKQRRRAAGAGARPPSLGRFLLFLEGVSRVFSYSLFAISKSGFTATCTHRVCESLDF